MGDALDLHPIRAVRQRLLHLHQRLTGTVSVIVSTCYDTVSTIAALHCQGHGAQSFATEIDPIQFGN